MKNRVNRRPHAPKRGLFEKSHKEVRMPRMAPLLVLGLAGCMTARPEAPTPHRERPATLAIADPAPITTAEGATTIRPNSDSAIRPISASEPASPDPQSTEQLHAAALAKFAEAPSFVARLRRRETLQGKAKPEELMLFKERKNPYGIHFKWIGQEYA